MKERLSPTENKQYILTRIRTSKGVDQKFA